LKMTINDPKTLRIMADAYEKKFEKLFLEGKEVEADAALVRVLELRGRANDIAASRSAE